LLSLESFAEEREKERERERGFFSLFRHSQRANLLIKHQGSSIFAGGIFLVLMGWAATGMIVEAYGFWLLFAGFFPTVLGFLRRAPVLGPLLDNPGVKRALNKVAPAQSLPM